ncbi:MAG TPA: EamA family transporter, partial [Egibacteraceae bacterium]|nr:EamA family transporter [Egibacteraceae bacterium]
VAYSLWFGAFDRLPASTVSFLSLLSPVVATAIGYAAGQHLSGTQLAGAAIAVASVGAGQYFAQRDAAGAAPVPAGPGPAPLAAARPVA